MRKNDGGEEIIENGSGKKCNNVRGEEERGRYKWKEDGRQGGRKQINGRGRRKKGDEERRRGESQRPNQPDLSLVSQQEIVVWSAGD